MSNGELIWYWRSLPLNQRTGSEVFTLLFQGNNRSIATLLESPFPTPGDQPSYLAILSVLVLPTTLREKLNYGHQK